MLCSSFSLDVLRGFPRNGHCVGDRGGSMDARGGLTLFGVVSDLYTRSTENTRAGRMAGAPKKYTNNGRQIPPAAHAAGHETNARKLQPGLISGRFGHDRGSLPKSRRLGQSLDRFRQMLRVSDPNSSNVGRVRPKICPNRQKLGNMPLPVRPKRPEISSGNKCRAIVPQFRSSRPAAYAAGGIWQVFVRAWSPPLFSPPDGSSGGRQKRGRQSGAALDGLS